MRGELVTVFGGSGFIGKYVVRALCKRGVRVRVAMRRPHLGHELRVMGDVGQVQLVQANIRDRASIDRALEDADACVNLVAVDHQSGRQRFDALHVEGARAVAEACAAAGITRLVHMSALGADAHAPSAYLRSKAGGEAGVRAALAAATIVRPSAVFGEDDDFINRIADVGRWTPVFPLIGFGRTKVQPVYVRDVAEAVARILEQADAQGGVYELGGPSVYTFKELVKYVFAEIDRPRLLIPIPFAMGYILGLKREALGWLPIMKSPPTRDQVSSLKVDNVVSGADGVRTFDDLGMRPDTLEAVAPTYLVRYRRHGEFHERRAA